MKKINNLTRSAFLIAILFLVGCTERGSSSAPDAGLDSSLVSSENSVSDISSESSSSESTSSTDISVSSSSTESSSEQSSDVSDAVPVEFTDEDRELQKILKELNDVFVIFDEWITSGIPFDYAKKYEFLFPEAEFRISYTYCEMLDNYLDHGMIVPNNYEDFKKFMLNFLTEEATNLALTDDYVVAKGTVIENSDDVLSIVLDDDCKGNEGAKFIEIDGKMYKRIPEGGKGLYGIRDLVPESAKAISKTDDTIEFTFLTGIRSNWYEFQNNDLYLSDEKLYKEHAIVGVLKYERGGWKRDWDVDLRERWNEYHEQNSSAE